MGMFPGKEGGTQALALWQVQLHLAKQYNPYWELPDRSEKNQQTMSLVNSFRLKNEFDYFLSKTFSTKSKIWLALNGKKPV